MKKTLTGKIISTKMTDTVVVEVDRFMRHPRYAKLLKKTRRFKVVPIPDLKVGDEVMIEETRPLSKEKRWRVIER